MDIFFLDRLHYVWRIQLYTSWCLYHIELMCVQCKIDDRHKHCPKDTVPARTEFPITDIDLKKNCTKNAESSA